MAPTDRLYADQRDLISGFRFDDETAEVFDDMIQRSVPGYATVVGISGGLAARFARPATDLYDLGCSLGGTTLSMARSVNHPGCRVIAVDNSEAMLSRFGKRLENMQLPVEVVPTLADINDIVVNNASVVALNYTLQFVEPAARYTLLENIYRGMIDGGVLILSEKIRFEDAAMDSLFAELYHDFKKSQGYSDLEISQKRSALENVLIRDSLAEHQKRLHRSGFGRVEVWFQCFNFVSMLAFK